ncbi:Pseudouridine-5'-phosphate glycosidase [Frankliniella fusca]|uniref:Pseudouridine-5'-phosphate glycosidase n=1 Tax=Frankliniella fusca TaxID=407009 RepID=A0AAE1I1A4_9NEOP|nr:Pseudouridine-5'-phosphate glycosidase [Frankliniella fusca]
MVHKYKTVLLAPLVPGKKLCTNCVKAVKERLIQYNDASNNPAEEKCQQNKVHATSKGAQVEPDDLLNDHEPRKKNADDMDCDEIFPTPPDTALSDLNKCLIFLCLDPCDSHKLKHLKRYPSDLLASIRSKVISKMEKASGINLDDLAQEEESFKEMLEQLQTAYHSTTDKTIRVQILSVLPASWSLKQVADSFGVAISTVRRVRALVSEQGIIPSPPGRRRMGLSEELHKKIISFYEENSRQLPGIKDHVTVIEGDSKVKKQKMLVLMTLKELYANLKSEHPDIQISFSKFAEMRPRECRYVPHPNLHVIWGNVESVLGSLLSRKKMEVHFDERMQTEVEYKKWVSTDRAALLTCISSTDEFIEHVEEILPALLCHDFIAKEQAMFLKKTKATLEKGSCIVIGDFSENYSVCHQAAIQDTHWDNTQITLHPFHRLIAKLKETIQDLEEVHYMTDGSSAQYKNKFNALNLRKHFEDFQVRARWHFFASCHGKGPCDGLAGRMKRLAMLESLRRLRKESILTASQFYEWAKRIFVDSTWVELVTKQEMEEFRLLYESRYTKDVPALEGISSAHCLIPLSSSVMQVKQYSSADTRQFVYYGELKAPEFVDVHGFIMVSQESAWHLAYVTERHETENKVTVRWLERDGPFLFKFSEVDQLSIISLFDIISVVNVEPVTEMTFKLTKRCIKFGTDEQLRRHPPPLSQKRSKQQSGQRKRR